MALQPAMAPVFRGKPASKCDKTTVQSQITPVSFEVGRPARRSNDTAWIGQFSAENWPIQAVVFRGKLREVALVSGENAQT